MSRCWLIYGGCRWRRWCSCIKLLFFLQQNTTASLLELYFNDSMQTVRARRRWQSRKRGRRWGDRADVVLYRHRCSSYLYGMPNYRNGPQRRQIGAQRPARNCQGEGVSCSVGRGVNQFGTGDAPLKFALDGTSLAFPPPPRKNFE